MNTTKLDQLILLPLLCLFMQLVKQKLQSYGWLKAKAQLIVKTQYYNILYYYLLYFAL